MNYVTEGWITIAADKTITIYSFLGMHLAEKCMSSEISSQLGAYPENSTQHNSLAHELHHWVWILIATGNFDRYLQLSQHILSDNVCFLRMFYYYLMYYCTCKRVFVHLIIRPWDGQRICDW